MERSVIVPPRSQLDRRQLLRIGAWTAPALVLAAAVPAAAASVFASALIASSFMNSPEAFGGYIHHEPLVAGSTVAPTGTITIVINVPAGYTFTRSDVSPTWTGPASIAGGESGTYVHVPPPGEYAAYRGVNSIYGGYTGSGTFAGAGSAVITAAAATVEGAVVPAGSTTGQHAGATPTRTIPASKLTVLDYSLSNLNADGAGLGPIGWAGGQIEYMGVESDARSGSIQWAAVLYGPESQILASRSGTADLSLYGSHTVTGSTLGQAPMPAGEYTLALIAFGSDRETRGEAKITLG